jgi:molecular chaperone GrpE
MPHLMSDQTPAAPEPEIEPAAEAPEEMTLEERFQLLAEELAASRDKWLRAEAETANVRARAAREVADARQYAVQKFAADVVEAAENLRRGLTALPAAEDDEPALLTRLRGGFEGVEKSFWAILERNGVSRRDPVGEAFDPALHQSMAEQPAPEGVAPGTVLQAWSAAWTLNGRLLKPAMVVVAAGEAKPDAA